MSFFRRLFKGSRDNFASARDTRQPPGNGETGHRESDSELFERAFAAHKAGRLSDAESLYRRHLDAFPEDARAMQLLGATFAQRNDLAAAKPLLESAIALNDSFAAVYVDFGNVCFLQGDLPAAIAAYERAAALEPEHPLAHSNLANVLCLSGHAEQGRKSAERALELAPDFPPALNNLGAAFLALGRHAEALETLDKAAGLAPNDVEILNNRGSALRHLGRLPEALTTFEQASSLDPDFEIAVRNLAFTHQGLGNISAARIHYAKAYELNPIAGTRLRRAIAIPAIYTCQAHIDEVRAELDAELDAMLAAPGRIDDVLNDVGAPNFYLAYHGRNDRDLQVKTAACLLAAQPGLGYRAPHVDYSLSGGRHERIRVGFVSSFFHDHTIGHLMRGIIDGLDRERFEVTLARFETKRDDLASRIAHRADSVIDLPANLDEARQAMAHRELDILFYPDIGMHASTYYLAFSRLAPVQCQCWGHPMTSGIPNIDYFMSSVDLEPAEADEHYAERLVRLPHLSFHYDRPMNAPTAVDKSAVGLPAESHIYLCPQSLFKLHPDFDQIMAGILEGDPYARIAFIAQHASAHVEALRQRWQATLPGMQERVLFVPQRSQSEYLRLCAAADVILDPMHFSGGRSSAEILATGAPIVTLRGGQMRSWVTYAIYKQIGVEECIAVDVDDFVAIALELGARRDSRKSMSGKILQHVDALYDNGDTVRQYESFFESVCG